MNYEGASFISYMPANPQGLRLFRMILLAFKKRIVFKLGAPKDIGHPYSIVWAGIQHKTDLTPNSFEGYPDASYF